MEIKGLTLTLLSGKNLYRVGYPFFKDTPFEQLSGLAEDRNHRSVLKRSTIEEAEIALVVLFQDLNPFLTLVHI